MATITEIDKLHGAALLSLITAISENRSDLSIKFRTGSSRSSYLIEYQSVAKSIEPNRSIALYLKISRARRSPWRYTFHKEHQEEILGLSKKYGDVFILLINNNDGVTCLHYDQLKQILDEHFEEAESVAVKRDLRQAYRVTGRDGQIERTIPMNSFPNVIIEALN